MNHDTQPGQTMETKIEGFFKPLAYALILLRDTGYPSVFYGDLYGMKGDNPEPPSCGGKLLDMTLAREALRIRRAERIPRPGELRWLCPTRKLLNTRPVLLAFLSNAGPGEIRMFVGEMHKGQVWTDVLGWEQGEVTIGDDGFGSFKCPGRQCGYLGQPRGRGTGKVPD